MTDTPQTLRPRIVLSSADLAAIAALVNRLHGGKDTDSVMPTLLTGLPTGLTAAPDTPDAIYRQLNIMWLVGTAHEYPHDPATCDHPLVTVLTNAQRMAGGQGDHKLADALRSWADVVRARVTLQGGS